MNARDVFVFALKRQNRATKAETRATTGVIIVLEKQKDHTNADKRLCINLQAWGYKVSTSAETALSSNQKW